MQPVNPAHAHTEEYRQMLERIISDGVCPFCIDFCEGKKPTYHPNPILIETDWWVVTENVRKYDGVVEQLLFVPKMHVLEPWNLSTETWVNLQKVQRAICEMRKIPAGAFVMRFGDTDFTGGSVTHLHAQLIVGVSRKEGTEALMAYIGYKKPKA